MELHNLEYTCGARGQKAKIVGRGHGSGMGKTSTRGSNGQKSRKKHRFFLCRNYTARGHKCAQDFC